MIGYIYIHTSPNGKSYVGQTYNINGYKTRWRNGYGYDKKTLFRRAIDKYGWSNISHQILHYVESDDKSTLLDELNRLEELEIISRNTLVPNGYNVVSGGRNSIISDLTRKNMSAVAIKRYLNGETPWNKGLPKHLQPRYGKFQTQKQKKVAGETMKISWELGRIKPRKIGEFTHSQETKKKISEAQLGRKSQNLGRSYYTDGVKDILRFECPPGFKKGRTNGHRKKNRTNIVLDKVKKKE